MLRCLLGGAITVITGLIASHWGPVVEGLFLAFPAFRRDADYFSRDRVIRIAMLELA
jgi:hypothetical protein